MEAGHHPHAHGEDGAIGRVVALLYNLTRRRAGRCGVVHTFHGHLLHGYFGTAGSWCVRQVERVLARLADRVVVLSERQRHDLVETYRVIPRERVAIVPLGLELDRYAALPPPGPEARTQIGLPPDAVVISLIGRLVRIKRPLLAIEAFEWIAAVHPNAVLLVAGDGPLRPEVEADVRRRNLVSRVVLAGWRHDLPAVHAATDIVLLTSVNEGTPLAISEGMAAARAVVATAVGGVPDLIRHAETGLLVPDGDAAPIAGALDRLIASPALRARLGAAARRHATAHHSAERLVADIDALYAQVLVSRGRVRAGAAVETAPAERAGVGPLLDS